MTARRRKPRRSSASGPVGPVTEGVLTGMREEQADWEQAGCCARDEEDHEGPCAIVCPECNGTQRCRECDDQSVDDFGGCGTCDAAGGCSFCYEGMVTIDA